MDCILDFIEKNYSEKRKKHTFAVCKVAKELAKLYGEDEQKAETAALFHDMFRNLQSEELNNYVKRMDLGDKYYNNTNLAHGKIAAIAMENDYNIDDIDVLNAVKFHTTGRAEMSLLEKIIYIADAVEPGRIYEGVEKLRELAYNDIDKACLMSMENTIRYVQDRELSLDADTLKAKEWLQDCVCK